MTHRCHNTFAFRLGAKRSVSTSAKWQGMLFRHLSCTAQWFETADRQAIHCVISANVAPVTWLFLLADSAVLPCAAGTVDRGTCGAEQLACTMLLAVSPAVLTTGEMSTLANAFPDRCVQQGFANAASSGGSSAEVQQ